MSEKTIGWLSTHEEWRDIKGYKGLYQVSSFGRVKGLDRVVTMKNGRRKSIAGRIMKQNDNGHGYMVVTLRKNNVPKVFYIHRLVAAAFLENSQNYPEINHKDEIKHHNNVINLEWCDRTYNNTYGTKLARTVLHHNYEKTTRALHTVEVRNKAAISRSRLINIYNRDTGEYYGSGFAKQLSSIFDIARTTITSYANGSSQNQVLIFKYADEDIRSKTFYIHDFPKGLLYKNDRTTNSHKEALMPEKPKIVCYDSLTRLLILFCSVKDASEQTGIPQTKIKNGLNKKSNGTKRYVFVRNTSDYMEKLRNKYRKMKNKPLNVYSSDGKFMFSDFNYNLANYFTVYVDYINKVARGEYNSVKGCTLEKMPFSPVNTLEDK